ncbi:MAG: NUDIX hydrolase [Candidatus Roizmanbacteria bacterium]
MYPRIGIGVIVVHNKKVLLGYRQSNNGKGFWSFPGGHLEMGESFDNCAIRETREECGLSITDVQFVGVTNDVMSSDKHYVTIFMKGTVNMNKALVLEPDKIDKWEWFEWENMPKPLFLPIQNLIQSGLSIL